MEISELAIITGCTVHSIRFYGQQGLLMCSTRIHGNYRNNFKREVAPFFF